MATKKKKEGKFAKALRTWSPGKYAAKLIKGKPIGASKEQIKKTEAGKKAKVEKQKATASSMKEERSKVKAKKAKKKEGKVWKSAVAKQKKAGGPSMNTLIKARGMHDKGSSEYGKIQNQINKAMGSRYRHKEEEGGKVASYKGGGKVESNPYGWPTKDTGNGGN